MAMDYTALLLFVVATSITPGPNNTLILASGVNHGLRKSLPHLFGIGAGFPILVTAIGLGAGTLFKQLPVLQITLKTLGTGYLIYLAYRLASAPTQAIETENAKPFSFYQALLFQWVNPKAWIMAIGAVVTFTGTDGSYVVQVLLIALSFVVFGLPCVGLWLLCGAWLKNLLSNALHLRLFNVSMAALLMLSLLPVIQELYMHYGA